MHCGSRGRSGAVGAGGLKGDGVMVGARRTSVNGVVRCAQRRGGGGTQVRRRTAAEHAALALLTTRFSSGAVRPQAVRADP